jgi:hypothetical protein
VVMGDVQSRVRACLKELRFKFGFKRSEVEAAMAIGQNWDVRKSQEEELVTAVGCSRQ